MKPVRSSKADETPEFIAFWALWQPHARHTDGRRLARTTFLAHVREGADPQDIVDGAAWFLRNIPDREREYVPLSSTWINRGAYEDLAEKERQFQARQSNPPEQKNVVRFVPGQTAFLKAYNKQGG